MQTSQSGDAILKNTLQFVTSFLVYLNLINYFTFYNRQIVTLLKAKSEQNELAIDHRTCVMSKSHLKNMAITPDNSIFSSFVLRSLKAQNQQTSYHKATTHDSKLPRLLFINHTKQEALGNLPVSPQFFHKQQPSHISALL